MFLRIPCQFIRSVNYVAKCNKIIFTLNYFVYAFYFVIQYYLEKTTEYTWWDILIVLDIYVKFPIFVYDGVQDGLWAFAIAEARNGNISFFAASTFFTIIIWIVVSTWHASGIYHTFKNCGFGYAYFAFMKGTLGGATTGIIATLFGIAFSYLVLLNIKFLCQGFSVYRNLRDDLYRRRG